MLGYCRYSANPVGRLVLYLFGYRDAERQRLSDLICSGLQLANFWQDVAIDFANGRIYFPRRDRERFGVSEDDLRAGAATPAFLALMRHEVGVARAMLVEGSALHTLVDRRLSRDLVMFAGGGLAILRAIERVGYDVFRRRPKLRKLDYLKVGLGAMRGLLMSEQNGSHSDANGSGSGPAVRFVNGGGLEADYERCAEITRTSSSNFYYAFMLLPAERRRALHAVYAFCRFIDDIADDEVSGDPAKLLGDGARNWSAFTAATPTRAISRALADSIRTFNIPRVHFEELINGIEMDLSQKRYATFADLYPYCHRVASVVGLICIEIFGYRNPDAKVYAENLGIAFQLTNILRDVSEDAARGRIYIPLEDLARFEVTEKEILAGIYSANFVRLMEFEAERAHEFYATRAARAAARGSLVAAHRRSDAADLRRAARADRAIELSRARPPPQPARGAQAVPGRARVGERAARRVVGVSARDGRRVERRGDNRRRVRRACGGRGGRGARSARHAARAQTHARRARVLLH